MKKKCLLSMFLKIEKDEKPFLDTNILNCSFSLCSKFFYPGPMHHSKMRAGENKPFLFQGGASCQEGGGRKGEHLKHWGI